MSRKPKKGTLNLRQQGAILYLELEKKAKRTPAFAGFLDPKIFAMSFGWFQTKRKRHYTERQAELFLAGFAAAHKLRMADKEKA